MKKKEQNPDQVKVSIPAVYLDRDIYDQIVDAAAFHEVPLKAELVMIVKEAIRDRYKSKRGRQPGLPSQAILNELEELVKARHVERNPDGTYVGVNAQTSGTGWRVTVPSVLPGHRYTYLGSYRTREEAAVVRGREMKQRAKEELIRWKNEDDKLTRMMEYLDNSDPMNAVPLRQPPKDYHPVGGPIEGPIEIEIPIEPLSGKELEELEEPVGVPPDPEAGKWS